ncbi:hypothetical protein NRB20_45680 [Nocardia sp. RB20]|uniref:HTH tetR-type domain-containing protein n=2 Tax=Nocardia macrotermitis TaxID=2585198 RepID=A0A7K0D6W1_9NOCA|nr:hypothetical protein [Nocardia macrotermitis]
MLAAARQLLVREGPGAITHQRVAQEAGVGRATAYRHWPQPDQLLLDAMGGADLPLFKDPSAPIRTWLHRQLRQMADELEVRAVAAMALTLAHSALWDPAIAHRQAESVRTIIERILVATRSAVASGELETEISAVDVAAMLVGPIVYRTTMQQGTVADDLIDRLLDSIGTWRD